MWSFNSWNVELELSYFSDSSIKSRDANVKEANFSNGVLKVHIIIILFLFYYSFYTYYVI